jgi:hypothetical protein
LLWSAVLFGVLGALIGLRFRAPALIPASFVAVVWGVAGGWLAQRTVGQVILLVVLLAGMLHAGYLVALALRTLNRRSLNRRL